MQLIPKRKPTFLVSCCNKSMLVILYLLISSHELLVNRYLCHQLLHHNFFIFVRLKRKWCHCHTFAETFRNPLRIKSHSVLEMIELDIDTWHNATLNDRNDMKFVLDFTNF